MTENVEFSKDLSRWRRRSAAFDVGVHLAMVQRFDGPSACEDAEAADADLAACRRLRTSAPLAPS